MAEPTVEDIAGWLKENPDQEGTSDYVHMASAYKALRQQQKGTNAPLPPTKTWGEDMWGRAKLAFGMKPGDIADAGEASRGITDWWNNKPVESKPVPGAENVPNLEDIMAAKRLTSDPRSVENRTSRILAGAIGGATDFGIGGYNAAARTIGSPDSQLPYVTPQMLENSGTPALPEDAPWYERMGEGAGSAFLGGGAGAAAGTLQTARHVAATTGAAVPVASTAMRMAVPTVAPTIGGELGGNVGGYLGEKYLGDRETGAWLGSALGGTAHTLPNAGRSLIHQWYASDARPDAPQIADMARRQGVTPTAAMLGNDRILRREQTLSGQPGSADVIQEARTNARNQIGAAYDASAAARGAVDVQPNAGTIGEKINTAARESAEALRGVSDQRQTNLNARIPQDTPTHLAPIQERGYGMMTDPNARIGPTERAAIDFRVTDQLNPLASRDASGQPMQVPVQSPGIGHNGGPPMGPTTQVAPYGDVAGFRTELGRSVDTPAGGRMPPVSALYEPTTQVMREAAQRAGVDPRDFNTTQNATRDIMRETPTTPGGLPGDYHTLLNYIKENPSAAFDYLNSRGRKDPNVPGILEATGHPGVGEIFGDLMRLIGNETINSPQTNPQGGARGPANFANAWTGAGKSGMHPDSRATILGDQLPNVSDQVALATRLNVPTSQAGLTRSIGGQGNSVANKVLGSEALAQLGGHYLGPLGAVLGRVVGMLAPSDLRARRAGVLEGPTARNALSQGPSPSGINELAAAMTAAQSAQQPQRAPLRITVP
jgi:hypothetical protein